MNWIHPKASVDQRVKMGVGNSIEAFAVVSGHVVMGDNNTIKPFACVGTPAEYKGKASTGAVVIGNNNMINEHVTIHRSVEPETATKIGNDCYIMTKTHIGHDAVLEDGVTLASASIIGGHSIIMASANIGLAAVIHQKRVVGKYAMVGMNSSVTKSVQPYVIGWGNPFKAHRINLVGLQRKNFDPKMIEAISSWFSYQQTGVRVIHELTHLVEEQIEIWKQQVSLLEGK